MFLTGMVDAPDKSALEPKAKTTRTPESEVSGSERDMQKASRVESADRGTREESSIDDPFAAIKAAERKLEATMDDLPSEGVHVRRDIGKEDLLAKRVEHIEELLNR